MTPDEIRDIAVARFNEFAPKKYDRGQDEHGGVLSETVEIECLEEEIVDLWFYLQALKLKLSGTINKKEDESPSTGLPAGGVHREGRVGLRK